MGEIELWFFSCKKCKKSFPIVQDAHIQDIHAITDLQQAEEEVKHCPYCGSSEIKLTGDQYPHYFG